MHENRPQVYAPYIRPFVPEKVRQPVYVRMDGEVHRLMVSHGPSECGYDVRLAEDVEIRAGYRATPHAVTLEWVGMPLHMDAEVWGKSTYARLGVSLNTTKVDPGFDGAVTIEMTWAPDWRGLLWHWRNVICPRRLIIPAGTGIATLVYTTLAATADYKRHGKYGGSAEPQEAR